MGDLLDLPPHPTTGPGTTVGGPAPGSTAAGATSAGRPAATPATLSDDELAEQIVSWSARLAAGEARLLALVGEFDRREAWAGPGLLSCAHWLAWRVGLSPGAAREKVRVARALADLPLLAEALASGRMSYSQVRAATRAAVPADQERWVEMAAHSTAGQLERLARGVRRVRRAEEAARDPEAEAYRMRATKRYDEDGTAVYTLRLPAEQAAVYDAALEQVRADLDRDAAEQRGTEPDRPPAARATVAEAVLAMAAAVLEQRSGSRRAAAALTVQVDPLSGWGRLRDGEVLPPVSLRAALRGLPRFALGPLRPVEGRDLRRHDAGRSLRRPGRPLRDLLGTLDGERCRFPGCTRHRRLHAHHVRSWEQGGPTDLDNLVLLCPRHHTLVHAQGFRLVLHRDRRLEVTTVDGVEVLHLHPLPWEPAEALPPDVSAETLPPPLADQRLDLGYAVSVLLQQAA